MEKTVKAGFRLSPLQKYLWEQVGESSPLHAQCALLLVGELKKEKLRAAVQKVLDMHEIFRTTFYLQPGLNVPLQLIADAATPQWEECAVDAENIEHEVARLLQEMRSRPFDLMHGPLVFLTVVRLSSLEHILLLDLPAYLADARTLINFVDAVRDVYTHPLQTNETEEITQYTQFAEWRNSLLEEDDAEEGKSFWREQSSEGVVPGLPAEKKFAMGTNSEVASFLTKVPPFISNNLEALVQRYDVSLAAFFFACWQTLLWRLSGQKTMQLGIICDGRQLEELADAMGLFASCLPLQCRLTEQLQFQEILLEAHALLQKADEWQEYYEFGSTPVDSQHVCFETGYWPEPWHADGLTWSIMHLFTSVNRFKIKLFWYQRSGNIFLDLQYDPHLYPYEGIERLVEQVHTLIDSSSSQPEVTIGKLAFISDTELLTLLQAGKGARRQRAIQACIHQLFEEQVKRTPDNRAVICEEQQLSYTDLNRCSNQLAHYLQSINVGPETVVALCLERSLDMVVSMLGVLKAGGAYLPLDPLLPQERLAYMLREARAQVLLTQERLLSVLPTEDVQALCLDRDWSEIGTHATDNPLNRVVPGNLAYILFTSGSTGQPKAVAVEHQQIYGYLHGILEPLAFPPQASFALVSTFAADLGNTMIYPAFATGGCLHIISQDQLSAPALMEAHFRCYPIDCLKIVPFHLRALLESTSSGQMLPGQRLILGGETATWELVETVQKLVPDCLIFNHYGPTECTVGVLTWRVDNVVDRYSSAVPLGRPLADTSVYLLDAQLRPVPFGVAGELYIGGKTVARGYSNDSVLTAEKFLPDPFSDEPGARLYKTGDLARYLPDMTVEFLGRIDNQVKIRGFRVELGEIEALLARYPMVRDAVVTVREDVPGQKRLVAYIVCARGQEITLDELRGYLRRALPEYMVPSAFVFLQALPLMANGKVDRRKLPSPDQMPRPAERSFVAPRTPVEKSLAEVWAQVLGSQRIGIHDKFFEIGGDSILCIQVIAKASQLGLQLTPRQLFQYQTIAELSSVVDVVSIPQAEQGRISGPVPLTPIQSWFFEQDLSQPYHFNQSILLGFKQQLDYQALERAIWQVLEHHDALHMRFSRTASGWEQVNGSIDDEEKSIFSCIDLSTVAEAALRHTIEAKAVELQGSLDLSSGPLVRFVLFVLGRGKPDRLLMIIHHLVVDGVSWRILLEDIQQAYEWQSQKKEDLLPLKTTSFKQWSEALYEHAQTETLKQEAQFWLSLFQGWQIAPLPVDNPNGRNTVDLARTIVVSLNTQETQSLLHTVLEAYHIRIDEVLLTALTQALRQWTALDAFLIEIEGHGREDVFKGINLARTVGWFTTHVPLVLSLQAEEAENPGGALKSIKEQMRRIPNHGIGYGLLRYLCEEPDITRQMQTLPQPEVRFNYLGQFDQILRASSLFEVTDESVGPLRSPLDKRFVLLEINGYIVNDQLRLEWIYSPEIHRDASIEKLARDFLEALHVLIAHCEADDAGGYTPSDFMAARLSQAELDRFLTSIGQAEESEL